MDGVSGNFSAAAQNGRIPCALQEIARCGWTVLASFGVVLAAWRRFCGWRGSRSARSECRGLVGRTGDDGWPSFSLRRNFFSTWVGGRIPCVLREIACPGRSAFFRFFRGFPTSFRPGGRRNALGFVRSCSVLFGSEQNTVGGVRYTRVRDGVVRWVIIAGARFTVRICSNCSRSQAQRGRQGVAQETLADALSAAAGFCGA